MRADQIGQIRELAAEGQDPSQIATTVGLEIGDVVSVMGSVTLGEDEGSGPFVGPQGPPGPAGLIAVPAAWSSATSYKVGDVVIRANALFICKQAHTNQDPLTDCATALSGTDWTFLSLRGAVHNYVSAVDQINNAAAYSLAQTPDQATVFCPTGLLLFTYNGQWKLSGSSIANSFAKIQIDDTDVQADELNGAANTTSTWVATLLATGTFYGTLGSASAAASGNVGGWLTPNASTTADANVLPTPRTVGNPGLTTGFSTFMVGVGVHKLNIKYLSGSATTTINVRERHLLLQGA